MPRTDFYRTECPQRHARPLNVTASVAVRSAVDPELLTLDVSIEAADVDAAHDSMLLTTLPEAQASRSFASCATSLEAPGPRRFFARDPSGRTINIASHLS